MRHRVSVSSSSSLFPYVSLSVCLCVAVSVSVSLFLSLFLCLRVIISHCGVSLLSHTLIKEDVRSLYRVLHNCDLRSVWIECANNTLLQRHPNWLNGGEERYHQSLSCEMTHVRQRSTLLLSCLLFLLYQQRTEERLLTARHRWVPMCIYSETNTHSAKVSLLFFLLSLP